MALRRCGVIVCLTRHASKYFCGVEASGGKSFSRNSRRLNFSKQLQAIGERALENASRGMSRFSAAALDPHKQIEIGCTLSAEREFHGTIHRIEATARTGRGNLT